MQNTKGFSITELQIVFIIIAIMAAIAFPTLIGLLPQIRLNSATRQMIEDMMWIRSKAVSQKIKYKLIFIDDNQYRILGDTNDNGLVDPDEWNMLKNIQDEHPKVSFGNPTTNPFIFHQRGEISPGTIPVTYKDKARLIKVSIAGRIRVD